MLSDPLFYGNSIRLTALRQETDMTALHRWYQDSEFMRLFDAHTAYPRTEKRLQAWFSESDGNSTYVFAIRPLYSEDMLGLIELSDVMWNHGTAWLGIAIGDPANRGRGFGREAMELLLRFTFRELNLHRIHLTVFSYNTQAMRLYESLGFTHEGTMRETLFREGQRYDTLFYGILAREWEAKQRSK